MDMDSAIQGLTDKASALVEAARRAGADASDAAVIRTRSCSVSARMGRVEETESSERDDFSLRVFVGRRMASVSASLASQPDILAARAVAMARIAPENPFEGLADPGRLAEHPRDLDLFDSFQPDSGKLAEDALATEDAALAVSGVSNSGGAETSYSVDGLVLVASHGFCGHYISSRFVRSCSVIAGEGTDMERDYDYSLALHFADMEPCETVGRRAGERAVRRLGARQIATGVVDVVFDPRVARGIAGHLAAMVNGVSVARKTGLLRDYMGKRIMKPGIHITDNPLRRRGVASRSFDGEGVEGLPLGIVEDGILKTWLLSSSVARELGLETNGHGVRSSSSVSPACTNFAIEPGNVSPEDMIRDVASGFYVTELFGYGVDLITGQYSRGASGFWIEDGALTWPASEVTLASDLLHMFAHLTPADDLDRRYGVAAPTLLIEGMTLAGK